MQYDKFLKFDKYIRLTDSLFIHKYFGTYLLTKPTYFEIKTHFTQPWNGSRSMYIITTYSVGLLVDTHF